MFIIACFTSQN